MGEVSEVHGPKEAAKEKSSAKFDADRHHAGDEGNNYSGVATIAEKSNVMSSGDRLASRMRALQPDEGIFGGQAAKNQVYGSIDSVLDLPVSKQYIIGMLQSMESEQEAQGMKPGDVQSETPSSERKELDVYRFRRKSVINASSGLFAYITSLGEDKKMELAPVRENMDKMHAFHCDGVPFVHKVLTDAWSSFQDQVASLPQYELQPYLDRLQQNMRKQGSNNEVGEGSENMLKEKDVRSPEEYAALRGMHALNVSNLDDAIKTLDHEQKVLVMGWSSLNHLVMSRQRAGQEVYEADKKEARSNKLQADINLLGDAKRSLLSLKYNYFDLPEQDRVGSISTVTGSWNDLSSTLSDTENSHLQRVKGMIGWDKAKSSEAEE